MILKIVFSLLLLSGGAGATKSKTQNKNLSFDSQVVEGEVYRPDYSVVTGEAPGEGWGVLRLRQNFRDHAATDLREGENQEKKR